MSWPIVVGDLETVLGDVLPEPRPSELVRMLRRGIEVFYGERLLGEVSPEPGWFINAMLQAAEVPFPPPACWKIACAACVLLGEGGIVQSMGVVHGETEKDIVRSFAELVERERITLATWNGRRFDVPVFEARCLRYGIALPNFSRAWRYRYADDAHYDVKDYMAGFGSAPTTSLDQSSKLIGLPGKPPDGTDGSKVEAMIREGRLADVQAYCLSDAVQTAGVLLHVDVMRGRLTVEQGRKACATLLERAGADERVRWVATLADKKVFLMEDG
jgi:predicted PolB exonuclease-like 3'-5' exonuclease